MGDILFKDIFGILCIVLCIALIWQISGKQRVLRMLRAGMRKAERDHTWAVRLPYNQVVEVCGWEKIAKFYPQRDAKDFARKEKRKFHD